jgi:hypothetical protein
VGDDGTFRAVLEDPAMRTTIFRELAYTVSMLEKVFVVDVDALSVSATKNPELILRACFLCSHEVVQGQHSQSYHSQQTRNVQELLRSFPFVSTYGYSRSTLSVLDKCVHVCAGTHDASHSNRSSQSQQNTARESEPTSTCACN